MIIGLAGAKGSGKDLVAAYLIKEHQFERRAFADPLKKSIAATFNIPYHEIDKLKNEPDAKIAMVPGLSEDMSFHDFIGRYAEALKEVLGENFWLDYTLPLDGFYVGRKIVVTDVRFENEARRINVCGGYVVTVEKPGVPIEKLAQEVVSCRLFNDGNTETLNQRIEAMLVQLVEEGSGAKSTSRAM